MRLADPWLLALLLVLLPMVVYYRRRKAAVRYPTLRLLGGMGRSRWGGLKHVVFAFRIGAVVMLTMAIARPQEGNSKTQKQSEGLDIALILDTSRSMEAQDFVIDGQRPNRLEVVKRVVADFVKERPADRIGMVVFGSEAFTQAPLTLDHEVLLRFLKRIAIGMAGDATAIGDGLATAVSRLKDIEAKSRLAILLTDGGNTAGRVDPLAAAQAAKAKGVRVYTIGVGTKPEIDEALLKEIAKVTGGEYYFAGDTETLVSVYATIDKLEKTHIKVQSFEDYDERYGDYAAFALAFLLAELGLGISRFRRVP